MGNRRVVTVRAILSNGRILNCFSCSTTAIVLGIEDIVMSGLTIFLLQTQHKIIKIIYHFERALL